MEEIVVEPTYQYFKKNVLRDLRDVRSYCNTVIVNGRTIKKIFSEDPEYNPSDLVYIEKNIQYNMDRLKGILNHRCIPSVIRYYDSGIGTERVRGRLFECLSDW